MSGNGFNYGQRPKKEESSPSSSNDGGAAASSPYRQNGLQQQPRGSSHLQSQPAAGGGWGGRSQGSSHLQSQPAAGGGWGGRSQGSSHLQSQPAAGGGWGGRSQGSSPSNDKEADISPEQQSAPLQTCRNKLFGQLLANGKSWCIEYPALIEFLKRYTSQPDIQAFADNPNEKQLKAGIEEMQRVLPFPGKTLFESVLSNGISPETIGRNAFEQFMGHRPPNGYMWAFREFPHPKVVQARMCFRNCGSFTGIGVFIAGMFFYPDGRISFFKQCMSRNKADPSYPIGMMVVMWICRVGHYVYIRDYAYTGEKAKGLDGLYDKSGNYNGGTAVVGAINDVADRYDTGVVPIFSDNLTGGEDKKILADHHFHSDCQAAMEKLGGIPVSKCSTVVHQKATEVDSDDDTWGAAAPSATSAPSASSESDVPRDCKHGIFCGGQEIGRCKKCDWGE